MQAPTANKTGQHCSQAAAPSAMVWDAGSQRARLSLAKAIANVPGRADYLLPALREWCTWRLYALQCRAPTGASVTDADIDQLVDDLFDMDAAAIERGACAQRSLLSTPPTLHSPACPPPSQVCAPFTSLLLLALLPAPRDVG